MTDCDRTERICIVIPTYNNAATLAAVIQSARRFVPDIIVVDDGSTDDTSHVLSCFPDIQIARHARNLGKGAALADGFARAAGLGCTHAISMDADGQHVSESLPKFLTAIAQHPDAIVIGVRELSSTTEGHEGGPRAKSRILRAHSNFWVWAETGRWIADTQSGFRAYPLQAVQALWLKAKRYDYEVEVLVKALWAGTPVVTVPIQVEYDARSRSHFRPLRDFALVSHLNGCLFTQRLAIPRPLRSIIHAKSFHTGSWRRNSVSAIRRWVRESDITPGGVALALGLGVLVGILPIWGFQTLVAIVTAHGFHLSKRLAVVASNISFPVAIPFILYASLMTGRLALTGHFDSSLSRSSVTGATVRNYAVEYLAGSVILSVVAGLVVALAAYGFARFFLLRRPASRQGRRG